MRVNYTLHLASLLRDVNSDVLLAGGCVRDTMLGGIPKDYDLLVQCGTDKVVARLREAGFTLETSSDMSGSLEQPAEDHADFKDRYYGFMKMTQGDIQVDILQCRESPTETAQHFDNTINCFVLNPRTGATIWPIIGEAKQLKPVSAERQRKVQLIVERYGWTYKPLIPIPDLPRL